MKRLSLLHLLFTVTLPLAAAAQQALPTAEDYAKWETLGPGTLSPDGKWIAYGITRPNDESELHIRSVDRDTVRIVVYGASPLFSRDSRWIAYAIEVGPEERDRLQQEEKSPHQRIGFTDLSSGDEMVLDNIAEFTFSEDGRYLAMHGYPPEGADGDAADLLVRDLVVGTMSNFGSVTEFSWAGVGTLLAMTIETESENGNGVYLYDPVTGRLVVLSSSESVYRGLSWREDSGDLAVLRSRSDEEFEEDTHSILAWVRLDREHDDAQEFDPGDVSDFPQDLRVPEHEQPEWADDGSAIYFGIRPRRRASEEEDEESADSSGVKKEKNSEVQIWHSQDVRIIPMQRAQEERDLRRTMLAAWHLDSDHFVQLGTDVMESAEVLAGGRYATESDGKPYEFESMFGRRYQDVYLIDARSGERRKVIARVRHFYGGSPTGRYLLYFKGEHYWTYDIEKDAHVNITENVDGVFTNHEWDYPMEQYPPRGFAGWLEGDRGVLVYDKYDVWRLVPDGSSAERLTDGAAEQIVHRYVRLDREEESIDPDEWIYLSLFGERTKLSGYARTRVGRQAERLVYRESRIRRLIRADDGEVYAFQQESFEDSPNFFVTGPKLSDARQVTHTNPFQKDFAWGRSELVNFESATGKKLQGVLLYPANYDASRLYPMIVYTYEILSNRLHRYVPPSERSYYNFSVFTHKGYFVLLPDIVYRARDPGRSAVEAVEPAVQSIIERGLVDPDRIGLVGHSWGGYQATYIPTQTNIFAASVAGAPLTNFLSMMGAIHWTPGLPETSHWETGQARMGVPFWEDFDAHVRNSPAAFVHQLETPMLMTFGDADGVVDWHQGIEFYNFARRAGRKDFVLLVYPDEGHGLRQKENQVDYQRRILQWFGHYLKGEEAPTWMTHGITHLERKRQIAGGA